MKVASFNVRRLGTSKVADKNVLKYLIKIVSRYSVFLILEVVDRTGQAMTTFLKELNDTRANKKHPYTMVKSTRLGRDTYKEQFVFLYRKDHVKLTDSYQYKDNQVGDEDAFAREPYILRFTCLNTVLKDLVLIPVHTKPEDSVKELDELYDVVKVVKRKWKTDNIMILGDFNADGSYVTKKGMTNIRIRSDKKFHWVIGDDVDTTANTSNDHTYDRIVMYGDDMLEAMVPNSAKPFNYHKAFHLSEAMALSISDHYPVEVELTTAETVPQKKKNKEIEEVESPSVNPVPQKKKNKEIEEVESPSVNPVPQKKKNKEIEEVESPSVNPVPQKKKNKEIEEVESPSVNPVPQKKKNKEIEEVESPSVNPVPQKKKNKEIEEVESPSVNPVPQKKKNKEIEEVESPSVNPVPQKKKKKEIEEVESPSVNPVPQKKKRPMRKLIGKSKQA